MTRRFVCESLDVCGGTLSAWIDVADNPGLLEPVEDGDVLRKPTVSWPTDNVELSSVSQLITVLRRKGCDPRQDITSALGPFAKIVTFLEGDPGRVIDTGSILAALEPEYTDFNVEQLAPHLDGNVLTYSLFDLRAWTNEARVAEVRVDLDTGEVLRSWRDLYRVR